MRLLPFSLVCFFAVALTPSLYASEPQARELPDFLERHCTTCHNPEKLKGKINLKPMSASPAHSDADLLERVMDVIVSGDMPPEEKPRPSKEEVVSILAHLRKTMSAARLREGITPDDPGRGNDLDHAALFTEPEVRNAAAPSRLWRMSPHLFMQRANALTQNRLFLYPNRNQGRDALHPSLSYMAPPHAFRDHAGLHRLEGTTTELLVDVCWQIAGLQVAPAKPARPLPAFEVLLSAAEPDVQCVHAARTAGG
jgi:hypothetical protein